MPEVMTSAGMKSFGIGYAPSPFKPAVITPAVSAGFKSSAVTPQPTIHTQTAPGGTTAQPTLPITSQFSQAIGIPNWLIPATQVKKPISTGAIGSQDIAALAGIAQIGSVVTGALSSTPKPTQSFINPPTQVSGGNTMVDYGQLVNKITNYATQASTAAYAAGLTGGVGTGTVSAGRGTLLNGTIVGQGRGYIKVQTSAGHLITIKRARHHRRFRQRRSGGGLSRDLREIMKMKMMFKAIGA